MKSTFGYVQMLQSTVHIQCSDHSTRATRLKTHMLLMWLVEIRGLGPARCARMREDRLKFQLWWVSELLNRIVGFEPTNDILELPPAAPTNIQLVRYPSSRWYKARIPTGAQLLFSDFPFVPAEKLSDLSGQSSVHGTSNSSGFSGNCGSFSPSACGKLLTFSVLPRLRAPGDPRSFSMNSLKQSICWRARSLPCHLRSQNARKLVQRSDGWKSVRVASLGFVQIYFAFWLWVLLPILNLKVPTPVQEPSIFYAKYWGSWCLERCLAFVLSNWLRSPRFSLAQYSP